MYHLTSKKWIFFGISLLVIVPGVIFLLMFGLNPGIDFTGGTTVDLRFQNAIPITATNDLANVFATEANAKDVKIYLSHSLNNNGAQIFWVELNVPVDQNVQTEILKRLSAQGDTLGTVQPLPPLNHASLDGGKTYYSLLPFQITPPASQSGGPAFHITAAEIQQIITAKGALPATTPVPLTDTSTATPTPTTTGTPKATATPTTGSSTTGTIPVTMQKVFAGTTDQIVTVQTQTLLTPLQLQGLENALLVKYGVLYQSQVQSVGPAIASSTTFLAVAAVIVASIFILLYIGYAFRNVGGWKKSLRYGACALFALLHDVLVVLGIWAILGHFIPNIFKVDTLFVTAVLTVIGFSVHDTIVVFDRIRENSQRRSSESFVQIVDASLLQTMARSLNTSLTVLITLSALTLFITDNSVRPFTLALLVGIFSGTYSSIFNASMLLVVWETGEWRQFVPWMRNKPTTAVQVRGTRSLARAETR
jgi:preprotein translocase SecF subunit